jgi:hypothetical protein
MPTVSSGAVIYGSDYNTIQALVTQVLGSGTPFGPGTASPDYGYNQTLQSSLVNVGQVITGQQWQLLAADVNTIYTHQIGTAWPGYASQISNQSSGKLITAADYNAVFNAMTPLVNTRLTVAPTQLATVTAGTSTYSPSWGGGAAGITNSGSITFASAAALRYFFNQGGSINFAGFGPSSTATNQDSNWSIALTAFRSSINSNNFTSLSGTPFNVYRAFNGSSPAGYTTSFVKLTATVSGGTISWSVIYDDEHTNAFFDTVTGGVGYGVTVSTATGAFSGTAYTSASITNSWTIGTFVY